MNILHLTSLPPKEGFFKLINQTKEGTIAILTYRQLLVHRKCTNTQFCALRW